jgi:hypothetical protein
MRLYRHNDIIEAMVKGAGLEDSHVNHMMMEPILAALLEAVVKLDAGRVIHAPDWDYLALAIETTQ